MHRPVIFLTLASLCAIPCVAAQGGSSPFVGRWDFNHTSADGAITGATWLGITEKDGKLDVWYQPTGGNVYQVKKFKVQGNQLIAEVSKKKGKNPGAKYTLEPKGDQLAGTMKRGKVETPITGVRAPELKRTAPAAWTDPEPLFNGRSLDGWVPMGDPSKSHWTVKDGLLVNEDHGANLKSTRKFDDFKLHFEVFCPEHANSGFYLRGRYEIQLESEPLTSNPPERRIGSIYGRIAPNPELPRVAAQWTTFDVTLVGREVTVVRDGKMTIDHKDIEGITGGALDANEGEPGPFYIQGDHTGGLQFRNITISVPKR